MAKKEAKKEVVAEPKKEAVKEEFTTMIDNNGYTWKVNADGEKVERI